MNKSKNIDLLLIVLLGWLFYLYGNLISQYVIPVTILIVVYYCIVSISYRLYGFLIFIAITFPILSFYLTYITFRHIDFDSLINLMDKNKLPLILYETLLLPGIFLGSSINFFSLTKEISLLKKNKWILFGLISVIVKRELIRRRYSMIMQNLYYRGINSKSFLGKYLNFGLWIIPLLVTTLIEGTESYEYNKMLKTNIRKYSTAKLKVKLTLLQKVLLYTFLFLFTLRLVLWSTT